MSDGQDANTDFLCQHWELLAGIEELSEGYVGEAGQATASVQLGNASLFWRDPGQAIRLATEVFQFEDGGEGFRDQRQFLSNGMRSFMPDISYVPAFVVCTNKHKSYLDRRDAVFQQQTPPLREWPRYALSATDSLQVPIGLSRPKSFVSLEGARFAKREQAAWNGISIYRPRIMRPMHFADGIRYGWGDWWFLAEGSPEDALDVARARVPAGLKDHGRGSSISRTKDFVLYAMTKPGWVLAFPQQFTTENGSIISLRPCELELETVVRGDNVVARLLIDALERGGRWPSWAAS